MKTYSIKLGLASTRRNIFSREDAIKFRGLTEERLNELGINYVGINDINEEGLLFEEEHVDLVVEKFKKEKVDALFFPHCNFGTEDLVCKVAKKLNLPVLLWGPRDEAPLADGTRSRDSQCGLFATGKILRRFRLPFSYIPNCSLEDEAFERGVKNFIAATNVVKELKQTRILQISTRPAGFWTMMCNEGELLEKFGVQIRPITMSDFTSQVFKIEEENGQELQEVKRYINENMEVCVDDKAVTRLAAMRVTMKEFATNLGCNAIDVQFWNSMQDSLGVMPCVANALMTDEGIPVVCETDIHGAITSVMAQAATMGEVIPFFADWTIAHPTNKNGELLQHCGPWPLSLVKNGEKAKFAGAFAFNGTPGAVHAEIKGGDLSILRFDGDNGEYSMLLGKAKGIEGPYNQGTYLWIEVENLTKLEDKLVTGPYVHHCTGVNKDVLPVIDEACKYIPDLKADFYDDIEEEVKAWIRGE